MGTAKILGIELMENFDAPYFSCSVAEFWRRWHISLTSWFKDYLYIPLGGSRKGRIRKYLNKVFVFLISGLWHGAKFSYVAWGTINGLYQVIGELLEPARSKAVKILGLHRESLGHRILCGVITFAFVDFSWIFFRASGFKEALLIVRKVFLADNPWILFDGSLYKCGLDSKNFWLMITSIQILLLADFMKRKRIYIRQVILKQDIWFQCVVFAAAIVSLLLFGLWGPGYSEANFIYFQF